MTTALYRVFGAFLDLLAPPRKSEELVRALTLAHLRSFEGGEPLPYHKPEVTALIWELKYRKNLQAAKLAGEYLAEELLAVAGEEIGTPLLIPVPMHPSRRKERGYNQTEFLCEAVLAKLFQETAEQKEPRRGLSSATARELRKFSAENFRTPEGLLFAAPCEYTPDVLARTRLTAPQQGLPKFERLKNVKNSMRVADPDRVAGRVCIVVDDVTTTGATLKECERALRAAGARAVHCLALARS